MTIGSEQVHWDLSDLYAGIDAPEVTADLEEAKRRAQQFAENYRGKVASLSSSMLLEAVQQLEAIKELLYGLESYAYLNWSTDTVKPSYGRFLSLVQARRAEVDQMLVFFELEWMAASDDVVALADVPEMQRYRHFLKVKRLRAPYALTEKEEQTISELSLSGQRAWQRYFGETMSSARYELDGGQLTQSEILNKTRSADRDMRRRAADAMSAGLGKLAHTTTFIFNALGTHKHSIDKMRGLPSWIKSRNLENQTDDETVEALIESVTSRYNIVWRYYQLTRQLLDYDVLYDYDRYAPVLASGAEIMWDDAHDLVLKAYADFDPKMAEIVQMFFERHWIDAAPGPNKRGGAYSHGTTTKAHPYIFMNYVGNSRDVMTLAHELGHGIHQFLSRSAGHLQHRTPLTTAEMASTFGEMLTFDALMSQISDPKERLAMRLDKIGDTFATVFRQIAMNRFEDAMHTAIRYEGELTTEQLSTLWMETQKPMFGDSLVLRDEYGLWWSYVPHFLDVPGYVYAYSFGELLVWSLYARYKEDEQGHFAQLYLDMLSKGGTVWPHELVSPLGVDLRDENFWHDGLDLIEQMVIEAEKEAAALAT